MYVLKALCIGGQIPSELVSLYCLLNIRREQRSGNSSTSLSEDLSEDSLYIYRVILLLSSLDAIVYAHGYGSL